MLSTLLLIAAALLAAAVLLLAAHRIAGDRTVTAAWQSLALSSAGDKFAPEMVAALPEPARRYLLHAIQPGATLASSVEMEMRGEIRLSPQAGWMPMSAREILAAPGGFVWKASIGGLLRFVGSDHYLLRMRGGYLIGTRCTTHPSPEAISAFSLSADATVMVFSQSRSG